MREAYARGPPTKRQGPQAYGSIRPISPPVLQVPLPKVHCRRYSCRTSAVPPEPSPSPATAALAAIVDRASAGRAQRGQRRAAASPCARAAAGDAGRDRRLGGRRRAAPSRRSSPPPPTVTNTPARPAPGNRRPGARAPPRRSRYRTGTRPRSLPRSRSPNGRVRAGTSGSAVPPPPRLSVDPQFRHQHDVRRFAVYSWPESCAFSSTCRPAPRSW